MSTQSDYADGLRVTQDGSLLRLTLCAPERRNAQTPALWRALHRIGSSLDPSVVAVLIDAEGPAFSAGLDRRLLTPEGLPGERPLAEIVAGADLLAWIADVQRGFEIWQEVDAIVVAAVQGHAIGAGFQLALAADIIVAADDAVFTMREATLGLVPDLGGTRVLSQAVGYHRALEICATGRPVPADEAHRLGLVTRVVPGPALSEVAHEVIAGLSANPWRSAAAVKRLLKDAHIRSGGDQYQREREAQAEQLRMIVATLSGSA
jgi:enoyl-CoA hydratase/carnithine racemase